MPPAAHATGLSFSPPSFTGEDQGRRAREGYYLYSMGNLIESQKIKNHAVRMSEF